MVWAVRTAGRLEAGRHITSAQNGGSVPVRNIIGRLLRELGDEAHDSSYIFAEPHVGYRMAKGEESREETP